ncbi:MAG TPA: type VI secretion system baseplate subunit TssG [Caldimonas sp.]
MSESAPIDPTPALAALFEALAEAPHAHDFFHTLRRIETMLPHDARLGRALRPALEPVRFGQDPELDFAPAALMSFAPQKHSPPRLGVRFFGLFGPQGPLPLHLTEYARERERHHADAGFARFADLFHHRLLTLFYRAWAQAQPTVHVDRPHDDQFAKWLGALFGMAPPEFRGRDQVADAAKRFHAGTLARGVKNAEGLATILREQLRAPVRVESFVGHWMRLRPRDQTRLGAGHAAEPSAQLGVSAVAGSKVWDRQYKFRVSVGPLRWTQYDALLPGGRSLPVLRDWVRQFAGLSRLWDLRLTLGADDVPHARLGRSNASGGAGATRLGLTSWLGGARRLGRTLDRNDLVLRPEPSLRANS